MSTISGCTKKIILRDGTPLDPLLVKILKQRNITGQDEVSRFLEPKLEDLPDPFLMKDMMEAVAIIADGIKKRQKILIVGDYDVDGTTATALLLLFFRSIGYEADFYIPNRLTEGYGLQVEGLRKFSHPTDNTDNILITVDNGISAGEAVLLAGELGYRTIITDHHIPPEERVSADAVLNPKQNECNFPDKDLAGVGVAFYLVMGIRSFLSRQGYFTEAVTIPNLKQFLDLVAIGSVADMVPMVGINRTLVKAGMEVMAAGTNYGLSALYEITNLDPSFVSSEDISFQLAPKINAAGRLGKADKAVQLFLAGSRGEAKVIAKELVYFNEQRKNICIYDIAKAKDDVAQGEYKADNVTVVTGHYNIGVAGIVASNLVELYEKPSVVLCVQGDGILKGSARSILGVDLYKALVACSDVLTGFGGHPMAGGLTLSDKNINEFIRLFDDAVYRQNGGKRIAMSSDIDADIGVDKLFSSKALKQIHRLEPYGPCNPQPVFRDTLVSFKEITPVGKDKNHLRLSFKSGKTEIRGVAFGFGKLEAICRSDKEKEILYTPSVNFFKGKRSWQVRVSSIAIREF